MKADEPELYLVSRFVDGVELLLPPLEEEECSLLCLFPCLCFFEAVWSLVAESPMVSELEMEGLACWSEAALPSLIIAAPLATPGPGLGLSYVLDKVVDIPTVYVNSLEPVFSSLSLVLSSFSLSFDDMVEQANQMVLHCLHKLIALAETLLASCLHCSLNISFNLILVMS